MKVTCVSVKTPYRQLYNGVHFEGHLTCKPMLHHGAWSCEISVDQGATTMTFRLGHLEKLEADGIDLLREAQDAGWSTAVAANAREVAFWCARERAEALLRSGNARARVDGPSQADWQALEDNLGGPPDPLERAVFETEFMRALREPGRAGGGPRS